MSFDKKRANAFVTPVRAGIGLANRVLTMTGTKRRMGAGTGRRVRRRLAFSRSYTRTRQRRRMRSGIGISRQMDARLIYLRKRMPKWKRRSWRRFTKKVTAVSTKGEGTRTFIHKPAADFTFVNSSTVQNCQTFGLYTNRSTGRRLDHLHVIGNLENQSNPTSAAGGTTYASTMYKFRSAIADFTLTNNSTINSVAPSSSDSLAEFCPVEVDVYEITCSKKATYLNTGTPEELPNLTEMLDFNDRNLITQSTYGALTNVQTKMTYRGLTPWDMTQNLAHWGMKIHKKTKYFLKVGDYFTYQMRDARNHSIIKSRLEEMPGVNYPGLTKYMYVIWKPVAGVPNVGGAEGQVTARVAIGQTYKYTYKIEGETDDRILVVTDV